MGRTGRTVLDEVVDDVLHVELVGSILALAHPAHKVRAQQHAAVQLALDLDIALAKLRLEMTMGEVGAGRSEGTAAGHEPGEKMQGGAGGPDAAVHRVCAGLRVNPRPWRMRTARSANRRRTGGRDPLVGPDPGREAQAGGSGAREEGRVWSAQRRVVRGAGGGRAGGRAARWGGSLLSSRSAEDASRFGAGRA